MAYCLELQRVRSIVFDRTKLTRHRNRHRRSPDFFGGHHAMVAALVFGIARRYNQTGQKYAGDPDITSRILPDQTRFLWMFVIGTYTVFSYRLSRRAAKWGRTKAMNLLPLPICMAAFSFKVAFTAADAPELLIGMGILKPLVVFTSRYSLVAIARAVFLGVIYLLLCAAYYETFGIGKDRRRGIVHSPLS